MLLYHLQGFDIEQFIRLNKTIASIQGLIKLHVRSSLNS
jgi:hypothetical protein